MMFFEDNCEDCFNRENNTDKCDTCFIRRSNFIEKSKCKKCHLTQEHQEQLGCIYNEDGLCICGDDPCTNTDDDDFFDEPNIGDCIEDVYEDDN